MDSEGESEASPPDPCSLSLQSPTRQVSKSKDINGQSKKIIHNVYKYLKILFENNGEVLKSTCTLVRKDSAGLTAWTAFKVVVRYCQKRKI